MTRALLLLLSALFLAALPALAGEGDPSPEEADDDRVVHRNRVVVRVTDDGSGDGRDYTFVTAEDGEPLIVGSFLAERGYLGVQLLDLTPELRRHFGSPGDAGVMVSRVEPQSPAAAADLRAGDIVLSIDGEDVDTARQVAHRVFRAEDGEVVDLQVWRDGELLRLTATLAQRERKQVDLGGLVWTPEMHDLHAAIEPLPRIEIDPEKMGEALTRIREQFESPEWKEHLERLSAHRGELEERIEELEERLRELQGDLEELVADDAERRN